MNRGLATPSIDGNTRFDGQKWRIDLDIKRFDFTPFIATIASVFAYKTNPGEKVLSESGRRQDSL